MSMRYPGGLITATYNLLLVPGAPTIGTATAGNAQASVTFTAPSDIGGGAITSYTVISSGGQVGTGASSPVTVTGLTNGQSYTFTVYANNAYGPGDVSAASNSVTPVAAPSKLYFEFEYYAADENGGWGFKTGSTITASHPNEQGTDFVGFRSQNIAGANGTGFSQNGNVGAYGTTTTRFGIALDRATGKFWVRRGSSSWVQGDPAAGTSEQGTVPSNNANVKLYFTGYSGDYLFAVALANFSYSTPSGYTAERLSTFDTGYTLGSITFSESNYKAADNVSLSYSGAYILVSTTY
jgi:hypothetical protein